MRLVLTLIFVIAVAGCANNGASRRYARDAHGPLFEALDRMPDGTQQDLNEKLGTFRIRSTYVGNGRLCRLVEIRLKDEFIGETFCKAKGGEWR